MQFVRREDLVQCVDKPETQVSEAESYIQVQTREFLVSSVIIDSFLSSTILLTMFFERLLVLRFPNFKFFQGVVRENLQKFKQLVIFYR